MDKTICIPAPKKYILLVSAAHALICTHMLSHAHKSTQSTKRVEEREKHTHR